VDGAAPPSCVLPRSRMSVSAWVVAIVRLPGPFHGACGFVLWPAVWEMRERGTRKGTDKLDIV
jgi:hypothetical protein